MIRVISAAASYFAIVFAAGFAFGIVRVSVLVPSLGERCSELIESPLMLIVTVFAARYIVKRSALKGKVGVALLVGLLSAVFLLLIEFTVVLWLRGLSINEFLSQRDPVSGTIYYVMVAVFAVLPAVFARSSRG